MFSLNIKPQYIPARYFSFCVLLTVLLVTLSIRSLQGDLFITDAQYMVAAGRYAVLNYGINDVGIQDLEESGFKPVYSDNLTVCLKRSTV